MKCISHFRTFTPPPARGFPHVYIIYVCMCIYCHRKTQAQNKSMFTKPHINYFAFCAISPLDLVLNAVLIAKLNYEN